MARPIRIHFPGGFYHVTLRGNHQQDIFREDSDRNLLNAIVERSLERHAAQIHAYCWMSNHLHLLVRVATAPLGHVMRDIASNYARAFQLKVPTTGHLFERRYHATLIDVDAYLLQVLRYIHLNPVVAGIVRHVSDYRWSSHHAYAGGRQLSWLTTEFALAMFAPSREKAHAGYCRFVESRPDATFDESQLSASGVIGSQQFMASIPLPSPGRKPKGSLADLAAEACAKFGIPESLMFSAARAANNQSPGLVRPASDRSGYCELVRNSPVPRARSGDVAPCHETVRPAHLSREMHEKSRSAAQDLLSPLSSPGTLMYLSRPPTAVA